MGCVPTKATENVYFRCRKEAAAYNEKLKSREGAAELLGVSVSSLADYELGNTKVIPVDKVVLMADLYNAPELKNLYCSQECPIGKGKPVATEVSSIELITLKLLRRLEENEVGEVKKQLLEIAEDGIISDDEKPRLKKVLDFLETLIKTAGELSLLGQKCMNGGGADGKG